MKQYFEWREGTHGYMIVPRYDEFGAPSIIGSFNVLPYRFMGLGWADWLRLCEQNGANLYGKNCIWVCAAWDKPNDGFLQELNKRTSEIAKRINIKELSY